MTEEEQEEGRKVSWFITWVIKNIKVQQSWEIQEMKRVLMEVY